MGVVQSVTTLQASMEAIKSQTREQDNLIKQLTGTDSLHRYKTKWFINYWLR